MTKRVANGYTQPAWQCCRCKTNRVVELHLGARHAGLCSDCGLSWGDLGLVDIVVAKVKAAG